MEHFRKIKVFKTGTSNNSETGYFDGAVFAIPFNLKWEYRMSERIKGNLILGIAMKKEIKSK
ncbi:MAG: hypothetical protein K2P85_01275 [Flavobacteriaceae bacterium]|nr:hypothetical protein [Flavobacteriaceae bacterium]